MFFTLIHELTFVVNVYRFTSNISIPPLRESVKRWRRADREHRGHTAAGAWEMETLIDRRELLKCVFAVWAFIIVKGHYAGPAKSALVGAAPFPNCWKPSWSKLPNWSTVTGPSGGPP